MSQDIVSDALNQIMNAKKAGKKEVTITRVSKLLIEVLEMIKKGKYIDFENKDGKVVVKILELSECKAIKPRYHVTVSEIDKYLRRFLPSRNFGVVIISTSKGLMAHDTALEKKIGGSLIAYYF